MARSQALGWRRSIWRSRSSISSSEAVTLPRQGSGTSRPASSLRPSTPNRSVTGQGRPKLIRVEWIRFLSADLCLTRCRRKRASSRSSLTRGSGSQIAGTRSRWLSIASTFESILSVLQASGARPLTFWASAISTVQPSCSSVSWTKRAPVIDSITAQTGSAWTSSIRRASVLSESASGGTASWSRCSPSSLSRQTSTLRRLRSNPACNIEAGLLWMRFVGDTTERVTRGGPSSWQSKAQLFGRRAATSSREVPPQPRLAGVGLRSLTGR